MQEPLAAIRELFDREAGRIYLDAATYGLPPRPTVQTMHEALDAWQTGSADWITHWDQPGESCRASFAELIGVPRTSVALVPSASVGVGTVAATLQPGAEVLVPDDEFASVLFPLLVREGHGEARVRCVPFEALAEEVRPQTRLVAFSLVQSQSGRVAALSDIVAAARAASARTLVDVTQAIPFVPVRDVDYMVCAAYKHLLCPRGVAFLSVAPPHWDQVPPILANWRSAARPYGSYYGGPLSLAPTAARFDVSLAWFPWLGASVSLRYLAEWHAQGLFSHVLGLTSRLADGLGLERTGSSILSVPVQDAEAAREALAQSSVRASVRAGNVRLSPHIYNTVEEASRAISVIAPFVQVAARR